jgi:uridine monophosphate synthetase
MEEVKQIDINIIIEKLKQVGILKYGEFTLKSGLISNYYCDFRTLISYPNILKSIYKLIPDFMFENIDLVCGVFFGGMPLANLISFERNIPQIFVRDNEKTYGTKKQIEGNFIEGQTVLLVEDVITTGSSVLEKIKILEKYGLKVIVLTILNRNENLNKINDYVINSILPLNLIINNNSFNDFTNLQNKLYKLAFKKQSNIILSVDLNKTSDIINLIEETKDNVIGLKIHSDIIEDFHLLVDYLKNIREEFVIIEDCKVADISYISLQKIKNYINYADYITYHCILGDELPRSLKQEYKNLGLLGVVEMSTKNGLIDDYYMKKTEHQLDLMDGCVIQKNGINMFKHKLPTTFSPGISISNNNDIYNQVYKNPLKDKVGEFWIIGRGIYLEKNTEKISKKYKELGWSCFLNFNIDF